MPASSQNKDLTIHDNSKLLVVDDEIAANESDREDIIIDIGRYLNIPEECIIFASCFDEALTLIKETPTITSCFLDLKIPKTNGSYDIGQPNSERRIDLGSDLIPSLNQYHKHSPIIIYSCYAQEPYIVEKTRDYRNITGCYSKTDGVDRSKELLQHIFHILSQLFAI